MSATNGRGDPGMKVLAALGRLPGSAGTFLRGSRGSAAISLGIGAGTLLTTAAASFDLYARVAAASWSGQIAVTMTDYVSREEAPDGDQIEALGRYLLEHQLEAPADLVFVISAIRREPAATDPTVLWAETIEVPFDPDDSTVTTELAAACGSYGAKDEAAKLPAGFTMTEGEVTIVTEVCARPRVEGALTSAIVAGDIYRVSAFPHRNPDNPPAQPVYATETEDIS